MRCKRRGVSQHKVTGLSHSKVQALNQATLWPPSSTYHLPMPTLLYLPSSHAQEILASPQGDSIRISKKWKGIELFVVRWMDLESVIQSEGSQKEKNKYRMLTHIYGI